MEYTQESDGIVNEGSYLEAFVLEDGLFFVVKDVEINRRRVYIIPFQFIDELIF